MEETATIAEAKEMLRKNLTEGVECPCCKQFVKMYRRGITSSMAVGLIQLYKYDRKHPGEHVHVATYLESIPGMRGIPRLTGDFAKLEHWGLTEPLSQKRDDGSKRNGYHRITKLGRMFVEGSARVGKYVMIYNGKVYGNGDETVDIKQALKNHFDYSELMSPDV